MTSRAAQLSVVIGIGGATCSGKTILAKHLVQILGGPILHQDDYAPPPDQLPYHPTHTELQDWDDPPTAILWPKFTTAIQDARAGKFPDLETREAKEVAVKVHDEAMERWAKKLGRWRGKLDFVTVDGFLMYWDAQVANELDVRIFLRVPKDTLQSRREGRSYLLEDGNTWTDPPGYFDKIVWPAYVKAHQHIPGAMEPAAYGSDETVPKSSLTSSAIDKPQGEASTDVGEVTEETDPRARDVVVIDVLDGPEQMTRAFERTCEMVERYLLSRYDDNGDGA